MELKAYLGEFGVRADVYLQDFFEKKKERRVSNIRLPFDVVSDMLSISPGYVLGGKKIRGALVQLGYQIGNREKEEILPVSLAIELVHSFLLVHDDVMDKDEKRRGLPSVHRYYASVGDRMHHLDSVHFGLSMAIDLGSVMNFWGWELYFSSPIEPVKLISGMQFFTNILEKVGYGQAEDITWEMTKNVDDADVLAMYQWKTGEYTIAGPLQLGGILAGVSDEVLHAMWEYGIAVGIAFQIRDDELSLYGDEGLMGKPVGNDVRRGKHTLLKSRALQMCTDEQRQFLLTAYGNGHLSSVDLEQVRGIVEDCGAREAVQKMASELITKAKEEVHRITEDQQLAQVLLELADYVISRQA